MFQLWRARSHSPELLEEAGKWPRGYTHTSSRVCPRFELSLCIKEYVPSITHTQSAPNVAAYIKGKIGNHSVLTQGHHAQLCGRTIPLATWYSLLKEPS